MLLRTLEYRGYDSTGAAIQSDDGTVVLRKGVGAPTRVVKELGIVALPGRIFCGQVRWATFGAVTAENAQPHEVRCKTHIYGAHNGNVTNCDALKAWLEAEGHSVRSDNDGEMVVHSIEHEFAIELAHVDAAAPAARREAMRRAIVAAAARLHGSYAAVVVDPVTGTAWAIKQGSSLYFGVGEDPRSGRFGLASSDLSSILKMTETLLPLKEGEFVEWDAMDHTLYAVEGGAPITRATTRSKLRAEDTALDPRYSTFMEQEIAAQPRAVATILELLAGGRAPRVLTDEGEAAEFAGLVERFVDLVAKAVQNRGRILVVSCGSSYNAACTGALFWNELARVELVPLLPGQFRERVSNTLSAHDLVITISQSGETKDLVDILDDLIAGGIGATRISIVNNVNSTIAQEKSDLVVPLRCGPEIAVPATKSFTAQLALLLGLAQRVAERRAKTDLAGDAALARRIASAEAGLARLPALLQETTSATAAHVEEAAQLLFLRPSLHLLATRLSGLAREGALKIREVVLDHAEGFEASEFKHGPNTLLGFNTVFGPDQIGALLRHLGSIGADLQNEARAFAGSAGAKSASHALFDVLRCDYPLLYLTGPDPRDVALTISQLNTHKIRGAMSIVFAEDDDSLRRSAAKAPVDNAAYRSVYVTLPKTGDTLLTAFTSIVALQQLALRMSVLKAAYLDNLGIADHGVHPDVPKNVSKSITVD